MKTSRSVGSLRLEPPSVALVVGLGNPGPEYRETRHNLGARTVEALAHNLGLNLKERRFSGLYGRGRLAGRTVDLLLPLTYMNRSGESVASAVRGLGLNPAEVLVVYDDLDLPFGAIRLRESGGAGSHNGLASVLAALGSEFPRLRLGIGPAPASSERADYVLGEFSPAEQAELAAVLARGAEVLQGVLARGVSWAMNRYNTHKRPVPGEP